MTAIRRGLRDRARAALVASYNALRSRPPPQPPDCPEGWTTGPPDFVGVGVQRAGTSFWYQVLTKHPRIARAPGARKETHFFDGLSDGGLDRRRVREYERWFPRPDGSIVGEWTPCYLYHPWELPLLMRAAPQARILVMLRDPVARFRSGLRYELESGRSHERAVVDAYQRGLYASQMARLVSHVPAERRLVLMYEEVLDKPDDVRRRSFEFLAVNPERSAGPIPLTPPSPSGEPPLPDRDVSAEIVARYRDDVQQLSQLLPDLDFGRWTRLS